MYRVKAGHYQSQPAKDKDSFEVIKEFPKNRNFAWLFLYQGKTIKSFRTRRQAVRYAPEFFKSLELKI